MDCSTPDFPVLHDLPEFAQIYVHRRTDVEAEIPIVWPLDAKSQLIGKDPEAGKD